MKRKMDAYTARAKEAWGTTEAYKEYEKKSAGRSRGEEQALGAQLMEIFGAFGRVKNGSPAAEEAQTLVKQLQGYITEHYYTCTDEILMSLGQMYSAGGEFTENIDAAAGGGTAVFAAEAIEVYVLGR